MTAARAALNKDDLIGLYRQLSVREFAGRVGVSRHTITRLAREYGIEPRPASRVPAVVVEHEWLYEQYVMKRRTLPDLAQETGMSTANMARRAKTHDVPLRARGSASHHTNLRTSEWAQAAPKILRPVLNGIGGWDRLRRFAAAAAFPTIGAAARKLGTGQSTLTTQIDRLERGLGGKLLVRAERGRPMSLTPLGVLVVRTVDAAAP